MESTAAKDPIAWAPAIKAATTTKLSETGRVKIVFRFGSNDLAKRDDNDPTCGVCFELYAPKETDLSTVDVKLGEVMLGSGIEPEVLVRDFWRTPKNWYAGAPKPKDGNEFKVYKEQKPVLNSDGEYSGQDTKNWVMMYGTKSWANEFMTLRSRWDKSRNVTHTCDALWGWVSAICNDPQGVPDLFSVNIKVYARADAEFEGDVVSQQPVTLKDVALVTKSDDPVAEETKKSEAADDEPATKKVRV
jgi:hypothetical protein